MKTKTNQRAKLLSLIAVFAMAFAVVAVVPAVADDSAAADTTTNMVVGGESGATPADGITYAPTQTVTVSSDYNYWTLTDKAVYIIQGTFVIPEGMTVTIEEGASLTIAGTANIYGELVVEDGGTFATAENEAAATTTASVVVSGSISNYGTITHSVGEITVNANGALTTDADSTFTMEDESVVTVKASGTFGVYGALTMGEDNTIGIYGTLVYNSDVSAGSDVTISLLATGAVANIQKFTASATVTDGASKLAKLTITDEGAKLDSSTSVISTTANTVVLDLTSSSIGTGEGTESTDVTITGVIVTENIVRSVGADKKVTYTNTLDVSGTTAVSAVSDDATDPKGVASVELNGVKKIVVSASLVVGTNVTAAISGIADISGSITATATDSALTVADSSAVTVTGTITASAIGNSLSANTDAMYITVKETGDIVIVGSTTGIAKETGVNATKYTVTSTTASESAVHYVSFDNALALANATGSTITALTLVGVNTLTASATLPATVTLDVKGATLNIGEDADDTGVTLTIASASSATVTGTATAINVYGTLYAENKTNIRNTDPIVSDVRSQDSSRTGWIMWTNLYTAISTAESGDTIEVIKETDVSLTKNLTIPAGVTVVLGEDAGSLVLDDNVTLTVAGTLQTYPTIKAVTKFSDVASTDASAIVVTGTLKISDTAAASKEAGDLFAYNDNSSSSDPASIVDGAPVSGAHYLIDDYYVVSTLAIAVANVADNNSEIVICGAVTAGDITFTADDTNTACVEIVVSGAAFTATNEITTSLTVGTLTLSGTAVSVGVTADSGGSTYTSGSITGTIAVGTASITLVDVGTAAAQGSEFAVTDSEGTMILTGTATTANESSFTVSAGTVYAGISSSDSFTFDETVTGKYDAPLTVASSATLVATYITSVDHLLVNGTFTVDANGVATVVLLEDLGTVNVLEENDTSVVPGELTVTTLYIGLQSGSTSGNSATFTGSFNYANGGYAVVLAGSSISDATTESLGTYKTDYVVEDATWLSVYRATASTTTVGIITVAPATNAVFSGTWTDSRGNSVNSQTIGATGYETVYADIDYEIYGVRFVAASGIASVYLDDVLITAYETTTVDGHSYILLTAGEHKITVDADYGYTGTVVLTVNGTAQSGNTFTVSGVPEDGDSYVLYLIQLSGLSPQDSSSSTSDDKSMGLTDYLLIILVVLIAVMAIVIAARLLRS